MQASKLQQVLGASRDGRRVCVPILGSGVNLQAVRLAGRREDDWAGLLARIAAELEIPLDKFDRLPRPYLFRWESILRLWARITKTEPYQAEIELQKVTCAYLKSLEAASAGFDLYREFSNARFVDMISLNFDRRFALSFRKPRFNSGPTPCPQGTHGETFYRHDLLQHSDGTRTRIWYPHGDTRKAATLKLGVRKYGSYIGTMDELLNRGRDDWRFKRSWIQWGNAPTSVDDSPQWLDAFFRRPIVFVGCGLSSDEWPLWWLLRNRAKSAGKRAQAYFVTGGAVSAEQYSALIEHGIEIISYPSFESMWGDIRSAIA